MYLTSSTRAAAAVAAAAMLVAVAPAAVARGAAAPAPPEHSLDAGRVDVAAVSLDGANLGLSADGVDGRARDPESVVYSTRSRPDGVVVGWDTGGIDAGEVFGDTVTLRLRAVDGPAGFRTEPMSLPVGERGTTTWTFPAPGRYALTYAVEGHLLTGEPVRTEETYTVAVEEEAAPSVEPVPEEPVESPPARVAAKAAPVAARGQPAPTVPGSVVLSEGHVDAVAPRLLGGRLQLQVKDGTTVGRSGGQVRWREPANVVFLAKPAAATALPDDPALAFLGKEGDEIFLLPQQQQAGVLWTGWSTEELSASQVSGPITWRLTEVDGPGAFGVFTTGSFGDSTVVFDSTDGLPDGHSVALGTHAHANWAFAKQGVYRLTFDVTAKLAGGRTVSDKEVYTFAVGDAEPERVQPEASGGDPGGGEHRDRDLAHTGVSGVLPLAAGGVVLVGIGGVALLAGRRRRRTER